MASNSHTVDDETFSKSAEATSGEIGRSDLGRSHSISGPSECLSAQPLIAPANASQPMCLRRDGPRLPTSVRGFRGSSRSFLARPEAKAPIGIRPASMCADFMAALADERTHLSLFEAARGSRSATRDRNVIAA